MASPINYIVLAVNLFSLIVTLAFPNSATPISVIPLMISTTTWAFLNYKHLKRNGQKNANFLIGITIVSIFICCLLFVLCRLDGTCFTLHGCMIYGAGLKFEYYWFAIPAFAVSVGLMVAELASVKYEKVKKAVSFHECVEKVLSEVNI